MCGSLLINVFTLPTSEPCQTGLISFLKVDISTITGTCQVSVTLLILSFEIETKPVWHGSCERTINYNDYYKYGHTIVVIKAISSCTLDLVAKNLIGLLCYVQKLDE